MRFEKLTVGAVEPACADGLVLTFAVPPELREAFAFQAGQHVTLDEKLRRSYSICSTPLELAEQGRLRVGVRLLPEGEFSAIASALLPGSTVEVSTPLGRFTSPFERARQRRYAAVVGGSGVTPVLSLVGTALAIEPASTFAVICANRTSNSAFAVDELADLKDRYPDRLQILHVLSQEPGAPLHGRLDSERLATLLPVVGPVDEWFLCGPLGLVESARSVVAATGAQVHVELFHVGPVPTFVATPTAGDVEVEIILDGRATSFTMGSGERVLDAALRHRTELPYACRGGVCSTCRARVISGTVEMAANWALDPAETAAGYVLTCQSHPTSARLVVDYDA
ncbi:MAG: 2Fe-2S iron-sulfur cluster binding domain-containing protein [Hamadaea sp.]|uniref:2Fe-2S iron-sulfur cluster-binding protein n=1 Tax=Hamadaea sp. TaxID=2024425 RepID=UPI00184EE8AB|nr:2Fe-2S iron-sulfur cluster-binding protein [Hamadaea sp.]NUR72027.1 2Fe-2S iron-sulfur cluster binding domain-containing protein [Hamadaea sp.]NUT17577.1 2Fe-2S iron-sulfur cluster binding domain-containing protein [Hamadaea sp.]